MNTGIRLMRNNPGNRIPLGMPELDVVSFVVKGVGG